jgi:DNA-directed RNA polymerase subunit RPC12/RpoP
MTAMKKDNCVRCGKPITYDEDSARDRRAFYNQSYNMRHYGDELYKHIGPDPAYYCGECWRIAYAEWEKTEPPWPKVEKVECSRCNGTGQINGYKCMTCDGKGFR